MDEFKEAIGAEVPLESVLCTEQLEQRPSRPSDYQAEIQALLALVQELKNAPSNVLQMLVETALELCRGHSAGISLLEEGPPGHLSPSGDHFRWHAVAGQWAPLIWNTTTRRDNGPCGTVLDRDCTLLFSNAHRYYSQFAGVQPLLIEGLLVPFHVDGQAVGTVWVVAHDDSRKFDAEDRRLLESLATFAATAYQILKLVAQLREANERLVVGTVRAQTMTEDAEQANHLKDEFLGTVSHELRTPLNAILGWARMLGGNQLAPDRARHAIATIERNASALAHIIDDLLDVSRIVAGALHLAPQPVDLVAVAEAALDAVRPLAGTKNVHLALSPGLPAIETVSGDAGRLQQVIWNLLVNAINFTPEGGRVDVFIAPSNDHLEVRVVDTGQGISPDFLPHVFERFRQADNATTQRHTGLGLGLAIVRQLVELHGGTVHAASEGVGRGATFTVCLPISAGEAQGGQAAALGERRIATSTASPMPRLPRLDALRILVVDDNPDGRTLTSLVLTQAGASVKAVASVREALQTLEVERPDALVSDIGLPDEDGYALIRQIRQYEAEHGGFLPAVALTGYARAEDRARILAAGFQAHVSKPVEPVELTAAIATITHHVRDSEP
jgi:signal transduction histidine kinase/ActR/RegA family two-component response regulator